MTETDAYSDRFRYAVDIVFCIDVTGSMKPVISAVKSNVRAFHDLLGSAMAQKSKSISQLRIRVIAFRDFTDNPDDAIEFTDFFKLPGQQAEFETFVSALQADGGGDPPESALEALAVAIDSEWERGLDRRRHVVVMFTDAAAYPKAAPDSIDELFERWGYPSSEDASMENGAKRLLLFAPDTRPWNAIAADWNNTIFLPSKAGFGLEDHEMEEIINAIANSI
jgi:hypothetical protein